MMRTVLIEMVILVLFCLISATTVSSAAILNSVRPEHNHIGERFPQDEAPITNEENPWENDLSRAIPWVIPEDDVNGNYLTEVDQEDEKRAFSPWSGKRAFSPWSGKRAFSPWSGKRSDDMDLQAAKRAFNPWSGKRAFSPWSGKRAFSPWSGKRAFSPWSGKRSEMEEAKRQFTPWGGKRASFSPWGGKREDDEEDDDEKRAFSPWSGKRSERSTN